MAPHTTAPSRAHGALDAREIASFLHYGFVPYLPPDHASRPWACTPTPRFEADADPEDLVQRGLAAFRAACADTSGPLHVVPLSGGLDSRLILGTLVRAGLGERLVAVTFGTPGTLDFELAREVARAAGVRHESIDLTAHPPGEADLRALVPPSPPWPPAFESYYNSLIPRRFGHDAVYWIGLSANVLNGSQLAPERDTTWAEARASFAARTRIAPRLPTRPGFDPASVLPSEPLFPESRLTPYEQLYLGIKYPSRFEPSLLTPGYEARLPFRTRSWVDFTLSLPAALRRDERFYRRLCLRAHPELFRLPTKSNHGQPLNAPRWRVFLAHAGASARRRMRGAFPRLGAGAPANTNYVDLDGELRHQGPLREAARSLTASLVRRGAVEWIDVDALWRAHEAWRENRGLELVLLACLELVLAASESAPAGDDA